MCETDLSKEEWEVHYGEFQRRRSILQRMALVARLTGEHHQNYRVGAAMLYLDAKGEYAMKEGANFKPETGSHGPRLCAEEFVYDLVRLESGRLIIAIVIAAPPKSDDHTGHTFDGTLPPCIHCRRKFAESIGLDEPIRRRTWFESMRVDESRDELYVDKIAGAPVAEILELLGSD
jgi:cytidine deaminase